MKPSQFEYYQPSSSLEAVEILAAHEDAVVMAGNQTLAMDMSYRDIQPDHVVDISDLDLSFIEVDNDVVQIGATTLHRSVANHNDLTNYLRALTEAGSKIAGPSVRNVGTFGGSIGKAHPAANYPTVLCSLKSDLTIRSPDGVREIPITDYLVDDLADDELIEYATIIIEEFPAASSGSAFIQLKRASLTWPTINAAAVVQTEDDVVTTARVGLANAAPSHIRVSAAEEAVIDTTLTEDALAAASEAAIAAADPTSELHADDDFKKEMAGEYTRRALVKAYERATE